LFVAFTSLNNEESPVVTVDIVSGFPNRRAPAVAGKSEWANENDAMLGVDMKSPVKILIDSQSSDHIPTAGSTSKTHGVT
jgi:NAD(P)H-hydrate repair Nnr-like enzyme with NAD(P)H-hydrate epimerase domain